MKTNSSSADKEFLNYGALFGGHIEREFAMNAFIQFRTAILPFLIAFMLSCFGLSTKLLAVVPAPDGGYPGRNTAEGDSALFTLTTGAANTAIGFDALALNSTGDFNTAGGSSALLSNTIGFQNTATGVQALFSNTTG